MKQKKIFPIGAFIGTMISFFVITYYKKINNNKSYLHTVGIIQTASHPALDAVREGFMATIKSEFPDDTVNCIVQNGQGSIANIHTIAQQFHAKKSIDSIFAIATPAAQACTLIEKKKPVGIGAVSVTQGLRSLFSEKNIYGVSDMIDVKGEVAAIRLLLPSCNHVGIVYCTAELNSVSTVELMVKELEAVGIKSLLVGVVSESDLQQAVTSALSKVDALLAPTDNIVANAVTLISRIAADFNKPFIVSDTMLVSQGALMARGVDYYESGKQAGKMLADIINNKKTPDQLSIVSVDTQKIFVNKQVCQKLAIVVPESLEKDIIFVE